MNIRAATGYSGARDAATAGREAASGAVAGLGGERPALVLVFTKPDHDLPALLAGVRSAAPGASVLGATGSGEIVAGQYLGLGFGVAVMALTAGDYRFGLASAGRIGDDLGRAGRDLARRSREAAGPAAHGLILLLADSLLGDFQQLIEGIYRVTGPRVPVIGGAAGDEQRFVATYVFHDDTVIEQGAACLWIASQRPLTVVTRHGWEPLGAPLLVTRAADALIHDLGGRPAADAYEEELGFGPGELRPEIFWNHSLHHPLGLLQPDGSYAIRVARARTDDGALRIIGCCPPTGSAVQVMRGDADALLSIVPGVARQALDANPRARALLAFSCAARATIFKDRAAEEPRLLQEAAGGVPCFGFYCCGEFSRTTSVLGTHNATLTAVAL